MSGDQHNGGPPRVDGEPSTALGAEGNLAWLYAGRALRSCSTAFLGIVFPLYLAARGESSAAVGVVLTASAAISALLIVAVGLVGDRFGRRRVLIALGLLGAAGGVVLAVFSNPVLLVLASGLAGVGRGGGAGGGGAWGPFFPAEQPLLAASVRPDRRTAAFGRIGFVGVVTGAFGSLVALVPDRLHAAGWSMLRADQLLFVVGAAVSLCVVFVSLPIREPPRPARPEGTPETARDASTLTTRQLIGRLGLTNALNGFGFGFLGPVLVYWFHRRFGAGPGEIGVLFMVANLFAALPYLGAARLVVRLGAVRTVVATRAASVAALLAMAWLPTFELVAALFVVRSAVNSLSIPARQSYVMGVADEARRGTVAAVGALPSQITSSISPAIAGVTMVVLLDAPIYLAALFMGANTVAYWLSFRRVTERGEAPAGAGPGEEPVRAERQTGWPPAAQAAEGTGPQPSG
ncbi:MAG TPA: MFS transporter [Acidimicrobiales bacterium]|nr:MFS transporter [Acidimicrobiales bacterium]